MIKTKKGSKIIDFLINRKYRKLKKYPANLQMERYCYIENDNLIEGCNISCVIGFVENPFNNKNNE